MRALLLATLLAAFSPGCSGSSGGGGQAAEPTGGAGAAGGETGGQQPAAADDPEVQLRAAQDHAVEAMCERLVQCGIEDAPPEERAEHEKFVAQYREACEEEAGQSDLSPRQVRVIQRCVNEAASCQALDECLQEAQKK
ncbi:MAG TPA: hypothetical protein VKZ63_06700 [Kofleriaceae bacterium]|nr:hypothetical protein [Kofleriaceae bacterium]